MHKRNGGCAQDLHLCFLLSSLLVTASKDSVAQQLGLDSPNCWMGEEGMYKMENL